MFFDRKPHYFKTVKMKPYLTTQDVAAELKVTVRTIERWRKSGYFVPDKRTPGNHSRYSVKIVMELKQKRDFERMLL
jgi:DNA-binding transcriptional MerR regulator